MGSPLVGQQTALPAPDPVRDRQVLGVEAGGHHDHVAGALGLVAVGIGRDEPGRGHPHDPVGHQVDIVAGERRVVVVGDQHPLAAQPVGRGQPLAEAGILDGPGEVGAGEPVGRGDEPRLPGEGGDVALPGPVDPGPVGPGHRGDVPEEQALEAGVGPVAARDDVRRGALVDVDVAGHLRDLGHDLDGRGTGPDDGDPLAPQGRRVVPARRVEQVAAEVREALDVGQPGLRQAARAGDQDAGADPAGRRVDHPLPRVLVPGGTARVVWKRVRATTPWSAAMVRR